MAEGTKWGTTFVGSFLIPLLVLVAFAILGAAYKQFKQLQIAVDEIKAVKKEVLPNGGASLRDAINRVEDRQDVAAAALLKQAGKLDKHIRDARRRRKQFEQQYPLSKATHRDDD